MMRTPRSRCRGNRDLLPLGFRGPLPVGYQVVVAIGGLLVLLTGAIVVAILLAMNLKDAAARLDDRDVPHARAVAGAAFIAKGVANDERGFLLTADPKFLKEFDGGVSAARSAFAAAGRAATGARQAKAVENASAGFERWLVAVRNEFRAFQAGKHSEAIKAALGPNRALRKTYESSFAKARTLASDAIDSGQSRVAAASNRSVTILLACLLVVFGIGFGVAFWVVRTILRPVYALLAIFGDPEMHSIG